MRWRRFRPLSPSPLRGIQLAQASPRHAEFMVKPVNLLLLSDDNIIQRLKGIILMGKPDLQVDQPAF
jgi:hypothetical protein